MKIRANGIEVDCAVAGPDGAPWLTFANSIASSRAMWAAQVAAFSDRYRVLTFDARGHGGTQATPPPYSFDMLVDDVIALWDALDVGKSDFVGLSLGGMVAVGAALRAPDRIGALVVANSMMEATGPFVKSWDDRLALAREQGLEPVVAPTLTRWLTPTFIEADPERAEGVRDMIRGTSVEGFIGAAEALKTLDYRRRLKEIRVPALFVAGAEDVACPPSGVREDAALVPGAAYAEIAAAAHISNLEQPDAFNDAVGAFLDRHRGGRAQSARSER